MKFLEEEIIRLERRLKKISANPDPTKLKSNKTLYQVELEAAQITLEDWRSGKSFAICHHLWPLMRSLGFNSSSVRGMDRLSNEQSSNYFQLLRAKGFPDQVCDRTVLCMPAHILGEIIPPNFIVSSHAVCDNAEYGTNWLGRYYGVPTFHLEVPFTPNNDSLRYVTEQFGELIELAESKCPDIRYDEDRLIELQEIDNEGYRLFHDIYELKKRVPCPINARDGFREERYPSYYPNPRRCLDWLREFRDELYERAEKGIGVVPEENLRVMWTVTGPMLTEAPFRLMQEKGVTLPVYIHGVTARTYGAKYGVYGDETEYGRKLSPLEEEARMALVNSYTWTGLGGGWESDCIDVCRDQKIDAIINFNQIGCPQTTGLSTILEEKVEKALGIPTLQLEGRGLDPDADVTELQNTLGDFLDRCILTKKTARRS